MATRAATVEAYLSRRRSAVSDARCRRSTAPVVRAAVSTEMTTGVPIVLAAEASMVPSNMISDPPGCRPARRHEAGGGGGGRRPQAGAHLPGRRGDAWSPRFPAYGRRPRQPSPSGPDHPSQGPEQFVPAQLAREPCSLEGVTPDRGIPPRQGLPEPPGVGGVRLLRRRLHPPRRLVRPGGALRRSPDRVAGTAPPAPRQRRCQTSTSTGHQRAPRLQLSQHPTHQPAPRPRQAPHQRRRRRASPTQSRPGPRAPGQGRRAGRRAGR